MSFSSHLALAGSLALAPALASAATPRLEGPSPMPSASRLPGRVADHGAVTERRGAGLFAAGALVGGLGLATNIVRIGLSRRLCQRVTYDSTSQTLSGADACLSGTETLVFLSPTALALNIAAFGLVAGGGNVHGRWAAQWGADYDRRPRRGGVQIGVGAAVMVAGFVGYAVARVTSYADMLGFNTCSARHGLGIKDDDPSMSQFAECMRGRYSGYLAGITAGQAAAVVGVGVLANGASLRRHSRVFEVAARHRLRLQPVLAPTWTGLTLGGRF